MASAVEVLKCMCGGGSTDTAGPHHGGKKAVAVRILLVDDNEMNLDMLSRRLTRKGFSVLKEMDGLAAIETAKREPCDLILLDMSLPEISGCEVAATLKAHVLTASIPIIALTAHATEAERRQALNAGCDDFDTKPVELDRLIGKMEALGARA